MADRGALKFVGFLFATATLAVMLVAGMVVKGYADGAYTWKPRLSTRAGKRSLNPRDREAASALSGYRPTP